MTAHPDSTFSRREWLGATACGALVLRSPGPARAQEKPPVPPLAPLNRFPRMVQEWYVERVRAAEKLGLDEIGRAHV